MRLRSPNHVVLDFVLEKRITPPTPAYWVGEAYARVWDATSTTPLKSNALTTLFSTYPGLSRSGSTLEYFNPFWYQVGGYYFIEVKRPNLTVSYRLYARWCRSIMLNLVETSYAQRLEERLRLRGFYDTLTGGAVVNFLRKERLYTKLKYSRSPAYDIVSGGAAAILAGLLGFLITERFGIELVDSGDFYYLFMYAVFTSFSIKPLLEATDCRYGLVYLIGPKRVIVFYITLITNTFKLLKF